MHSFLEPISTLGDALVDPAAAFRAMKTRRTSLFAIVMLALAMVGGSLLQAPVVNRANASALQASFDAGGSASLSNDQRAELLRNAENPGLAAEVLNPMIYVILVVIAIACETIIAWILIALLGGEPQFARLFTALLSIGVWTIGLYYVTSAAIIRAAFIFYDRVADTDVLFPSALNFFNANELSGLVRGALAAINPFLVLGIVLHTVALLVVGRIRPMTACAIACLLACAEAGASGLASSVLG